MSNLANIYEKSDEETAEWAEFLEAVHAEYGGEAFTTADLAAFLEDNPNLLATLPNDLSADWNKRNNGVSFGRRLGKAFSAREGRRHGETEARIERAGESRNALKWRVVRNLPAKMLQIQSADPGPVAEFEAEELEETRKPKRTFIAA